jgi:hypothetical protein
MSAFYVREYRPWDAFKMEMRTDHLDRPELQNKEAFHEYLERIRAFCKVYVIESEDFGIMAIMPVFFHWPGVCEASLYSSPIIEDHGADAYRICEMLASYVEENFNIHRIQATVSANDPVAFKFVTGIGFVAEGLMKKYNPRGEDYFMLARVSEVKQWPVM